MKGKRRGRRERRTKRHRRRLRYTSFAAGLQELSGLRQARFAVPAADVESVTVAKRRLGTRAVGRFIATLLRALVRVMRTRK